MSVIAVTIKMRLNMVSIYLLRDPGGDFFFAPVSGAIVEQLSILGLCARYRHSLPSVRRAFP